MIWTDGNRLCADTKAELIAYANGKGMRTHWFINHGTHGYFELIGRHIRRLILHDTSGTDGKGKDSKVKYLIDKDSFLCKSIARYLTEAEKEY